MSLGRFFISLRASKRGRDVEFDYYLAPQRWA
jgi:hypothetical protein